VNVVEQAHADGCDTVVYASTSSAYGSRTEPSPEDMDLEAATGYDASMLGREHYAEYYNNFYDDLACAGTRFFSVYQGYGGNEAPQGRVREHGQPVRGQDSRRRVTGALGRRLSDQDFTHVDDIVRGLVTIAEHELAGVYNLGTGRSYSFNEMVEMINDALGTEVEPTYEPIPIENYVHDTCADISKVRDATGWEPEISFEEGVQQVCAPYVDGE